VAGVAIGPTAVGAGTRHLPPPRTHAPATNPRSVAEQGQMYSTVFGREAGVRERMSGHVMLTGGRGLWTTAMASVCRMRGVCVIGSRLQSPQSCWSYVASFRLTHCQDSLQQQHERVVSTFTPATFCPAGIHKPHATQPNLLLLLLCDLSLPLCGLTEIAVRRCSWRRV